MKWLHTERSRQDYQSAPPEIRKAFEKQVRLLAHNLRHPSLRAKKYHEAAGVWQARVTRNWRFYFTIRPDAYVIVAILSHPK